jgi:hypothetical protein
MRQKTRYMILHHLKTGHPPTKRDVVQMSEKSVPEVCLNFQGAPDANVMMYRKSRHLRTQLCTTETP